MPISFYPDIGWFYESARQAIISGHLPLLGITSSVVWIHQGPIWTYFLIPLFVIFKFNPYAPVIMTFLYYLLHAVLLYWLARIVFHRSVAWTSLILSLISPLLFTYGMMPFVTSMVPSFTVLTLIFLYRRQYFCAFLFIGFLFQLERISLLLWPLFFWLIFRYKRHFSMLDIFAFILGSLPLVLAGPVEFFGPFLFSFYKLVSLIQSPPFNWSFYLDLLAKLFLPSLPLVASILLFSSIIYLFLKKHYFSWWLLIVFIGLYLSKTASEAYFIQILPLIIVSVSVLLSKYSRYLLLIILVLNIYYLSTHQFLMGFSGYGLTLPQKIAIVNKTGFHPEKITIYGPGREFSSVADPYRYLYKYYYQDIKPGTSVVISEYDQMVQ